MKLKDGGEIHVRCFGRYNSSLWDDVMAELPALTEQDVIIVNFGAWYPRFNFNEPRVTQPALALPASCSHLVLSRTCLACSSSRCQLCAKVTHSNGWLRGCAHTKRCTIRDALLAASA